MSTPESEIPKLTVPEFAARIRAKHPQYQSIPDDELAAKVAKKYPQYSSRVDFGDTVAPLEIVPSTTPPNDKPVARPFTEAETASMSATGRLLNPAVPPRVKRILKPNEEGIVSLAGDEKLPPSGIKVSAVADKNRLSISPNQAQQPTTITPETATRPRTVTPAPVSLDPVIQSRLEAVKQQRRQAESQARVQRARAKMQAKPSIVEALSGVTANTNRLTRQVENDANIQQNLGLGKPLYETLSEQGMRKASRRDVIRPQIEKQVRGELAARKAKESAVPAGIISNERIYSPERLRSEADIQREVDLRTNQALPEIQWREQNQPEIDRLAGEYRKAIKAVAPAGGSLAGSRTAEVAAKGTAGITDFLSGAVKGVGQLTGKLTGNAQTTDEAANQMRVHAAALHQAAMEEGANRTEATKFVSDVAGGLIGSAPEMGLMALGVPAPLAFAVGGGTRAVGRDANVGAEALKSGATGFAFELGGAGQGLTRTLTKAGGVGLGTAGVELATGATPRQAAQAGATNALISLGFNAREVPKAVLDYTVRSPLTPEPVRDALARLGEYDSWLYRAEDGRNLSIYRDPKTGAFGAVEIDKAQADKYDQAVNPGKVSKKTRQTTDLETDAYDELARVLGVETTAPKKGLPSEAKVEAKPDVTAQPETVKPPEPQVPIQPKPVVVDTEQQARAGSAVLGSLVPTKADLEVIPKEERRATQRTDESTIAFADNVAKRFEGGVTKQPDGTYRIQMGENVSEARTPQEVVEQVKGFADQITAESGGSPMERVTLPEIERILTAPELAVKPKAEARAGIEAARAKLADEAQPSYVQVVPQPKIEASRQDAAVHAGKIIETELAKFHERGVKPIQVKVKYHEGAGDDVSHANAYFEGYKTKSESFERLLSVKVSKRTSPETIKSVLLHEIAHDKVKGHGEEFKVEMQRLAKDVYGIDLPTGTIEQMENSLTKAFRERHPTPSVTEGAQLPERGTIARPETESPQAEAVKPKTQGEVGRELATPPTETKRQVVEPEVAKPTTVKQKITEWGTRLKTIAESKNLDDLKALSDEMAAHKSDPKVARLRTIIQAELARARQPEIPERPAEVTPTRAPLKSKAAEKMIREAERPEGKTIRPKPTHRIGVPRSNPAKNSIADEIRAQGGIKDTKDREYAGDPAIIKAQKEQESLFAKGEAEGNPSVEAKGNRVTISGSTVKDFSDAVVKLRGGESVTGAYMPRVFALKVAKGLESTNPELAEVLKDAAQKHPFIRIESAQAERHEGLHEQSRELSGQKELDERLTPEGFKSVTSAPEWEAIQDGLLNLGYQTTLPGMVEEAFANLADGKHNLLGVTLEQGESWLKKWFQAYAEANGTETPRQFKEMFYAAQDAAEAAYLDTRRQEAESGQRNQDVPSVAERPRERGKEPPEGDAGFARGQSQVNNPAFKRWFGDSKVVDEKGKPLVVYSGHGNMELYGDRFDPKRRGGTGVFYATESTDIASNYATSKIGGQEEFHEGGDQYRFKLKNGKWGKKIWQIELTPEQQDIARNLINTNDEGEQRYDIEQYWKDNARYDADAQRAIYRGGLRDLQSIWQFLEYMGDNVAYAESDELDAEGNRKSYFQRQRKNTFEQLLDKLGLEWQSADWSQPGVFPVYLSIQNPIDAEKPFPPDLLAALKQAAKKTRTVAEGKEFEGKWTSDYPLRQWVQEIEEGYEYWSTQVPKKAVPIIKGFGYDGIKEIGLKGEPDRAKRQINWIAFDGEQIKSAFNRGTFDPNDPNILFARESDPWERLSNLADDFERIASEPDLPEGQKPLSLPETLKAAGLESGPTKGYEPETLEEGVEYGKQMVAEKGLDGAMEFVRTGDGIEWASTGFEASAQLRAEESRLRAEGKTEEADQTQEKRLKFLDEFALAAVERGRSIVGIKAISEFAPDRMAYMLNKASLKKRKRGISPDEDARIAKLGEELGALENRNKALQKALDEAVARAKKSRGTVKDRKSDYQSKLDDQAETILQTLKPKVGKFDFASLGKTSEKGTLQVGIPALKGDAELLAQYAASQLGKHDTVAELNKHLLSEFGQEIEPFLSKIRQRAYGIRQEARLAEIEAQETEPKRRKTILGEIQKEIADSLTVIREAQKAQDAALKAERAAERKSERVEARSQAKEARETEREARKQVVKDARADLKRLRTEMKAASKAETAGYRETIKASREAARRAELWDTPLRNEAAAARERLKTATDPKDPQTMEDLTSVAAEKFLPDEIGGVPRKGAIEPAKVYRDLKDEFPKLVTKKNQGEIYKRGYQRIQDMTAAAREAARLRSATTESKRLWDKLGVDTDAQAVLIKQAEVRRQTDELRRKAVAEFNRVNKTLLERAWMETQAIPRSLMSSIDAPLGRQGVYFLLTHPIQASKAAVPATLQGYGSIHVKDFIRAEHDLAKHPDYDLAQKSGLDLSTPSGTGDPALQAEEQFQSPLASKIFPHVRLSEQGYVLGMNAERLAMFSRLADVGRADGYTPKDNPEFFEEVARFINDGTGRGNLPDAVKRASALTNFFFFSTRLNISRIQLLNDLFNPVKYIPDAKNPLRAVPGFGSYSPAMRKAMSGELLRLGLALGTVFLLAKAMGIGTEFDPEDPDAFLLRVRNTRYDITGGEAGTVRFLYRIMKGLYGVATGADMQEYEQPLTIAGKFLRYKLAPLPAGVVDGLTGKDAVGNPANLTKFKSPKQVMQENIIARRLFPIMTGNLIDAVSEEGYIGLPMALPALAGFGMSSYPDRGIRAIKNQAVVDELEKLKITSQSLIGQKTKDEDLDAAIHDRILKRVEKLEIPQGATDVGKEKLIREQLETIRTLAKAETVVAEPARYKDYLKNKDGNESLSFLTDEEKKHLTEADLKKYRSDYADAYVEFTNKALSSEQYPKLSDDDKVKLLARVSRIASTIAKRKLAEEKRK